MTVGHKTLSEPLWTLLRSQPILMGKCSHDYDDHNKFVHMYIVVKRYVT